MKSYKIIASLLVSLSLSLNSCTDEFDKMNTDPNNPTSISPQYLLPYAIERSVDRYWGGNARFERLNLDGSMLWIQYLARNIYSNEGDNYGITPTFYNNTWKSFFNDGLVNFQSIIKQAGPESKTPNPNYEGAAMVMRSWVFSVLTDLYGAIPYSQALKGTDGTPVYTPEYDSMDKVYAGLLNDLKTANEKLVVGGPAISGDILYEGNILKWKKFANSLRLRLANRQAAKKSAESKAIMAEILGDATKYPVFTSNDDNAMLKNTAVRPSNNEWHEVMVMGSRTDWSMSKTFVDKLTGLGDTRLSVFANLNSAGKYEGIPNGLPDAIATTYLSSASTLGSFFTQATTPSVIMTYSELQLILAEAAIDGDISGDANAYMQAGIKASFDQYKVALPSGYYATVGTATKEKILDQKWIALFGNAVEAWTEYRRTGYPVLPAKDPRAVFENEGVLPTRLPYPTTEYSLNKVSLDKGVSLNGGADNMRTKLWWAEK
ncbi:SusD/RagB family nutrient-binding outer membrane lipoprotein [Emticicia sp. 21SJ11W-3]|uniref:SusD/RagB family nutrient-binding outer membrane lipoprotein n=1 Tax=Emticicia sp. 21SJ11W-3 TaxID=2916755 RepID=UPI00209CE338|nr:SusD/RagB family nutrient-binding outer membrane lipoprotein [Emticicia sp. 21SJ11W-3]UTA70248.1 SusD/RagB family nutrient-binding outer membrane lipoprotein [Emticicia sp. 21SJ11W-3]